MRSLRSRRGGNAIEFALILPTLVLLLFGTFELMWYFNRYTVMTAAARDAVRTAALTPNAEDPAQVAEDTALAYLERLYDATDATVTTTIQGVPPTRTITVRVERPYTAIGGSLVPAPSRISSAFSLRMEDQL